MILKCSYNSSPDDGDGLAEEGSENENEMGMGERNARVDSDKAGSKIPPLRFSFCRTHPKHVENLIVGTDSQESEALIDSPWHQ